MSIPPNATAHMGDQPSPLSLSASFLRLRRLFGLSANEVVLLHGEADVMLTMANGEEVVLLYNELEEATMLRGIILTSLVLRTTADEIFRLRQRSGSDFEKAAGFLSRRHMAIRLRSPWERVHEAWTAWVQLAGLN